jgi:hypothetical protein
MITRILAGIAAAGIAVTAWTMPAQASARPVTWAQRTCSAFSRWQAHPATGSLDRLVTYSLRLPRGYLAADVGQLLAVSVGAKPDPNGVDVAEQYLYEDCHGGYGL